MKSPTTTFSIRMTFPELAAIRAAHIVYMQTNNVKVSLNSYINRAISEYMKIHDIMVPAEQGVVDSE